MKLEIAKHALVISLLAAFLLPAGLFSAFGTNQLILKDFRYNVYSTEHFDIYYYDEGKNILPFVAELLENVYSDVKADVKCDIPAKTPYFLYIGQNEFEQSNVVAVGDGTGGVTEAYKYRFLVPHLGPKEWLTDVIHHEFTHVCQFNVLYNGFFKTFNLIKSIFYPSWLLEGLAVYSEKEYDRTVKDMYMRDAVMLPKGFDEKTEERLLPLEQLHNYNHVKPHQVVLAYKEGGTFIEYLVEEYGLEKVNEILQSYRQKYDAATVLRDAINTDLLELDSKFREWVKERYSGQENLKEPETYGKKITLRGTYKNFNTNPVFLDNDGKVAYITDRNGYYEMVIHDLKTGQVKSVVNNIKLSDVDTIFTTGKGLSVSSDSKLIIFVGKKNQVDYIYIYDLQKEKIIKLETGIEIIQSAVISPDNKKIFFIGMQGCRVNVYSIGLGGGKPEQITFDENDKSDIVISKDASMLAYSVESKVDDEKKPFQRDIAVYSFASKLSLELTGMEGDEINPEFSPDGKSIVFISDNDGVNDLYSVNIADKNIVRLTQVIGGMFDPSFSKDGKKIALSSFRNCEENIYICDYDKFENNGQEELQAAEKETEEAYIFEPSASKPCKLKYSTDLFFPFLYYSTYDGLYLVMLWQVSDMLGNHTFTTTVQYTQYPGILDYQATYFYKRFRTQLFADFTGSTSYDLFKNEYVLTQQQTGGAVYPISKFDRIEFALANSLSKYKIQHRGMTNYVHDTSTGKYLEETAGSRMALTSEYATDAFGGDTRYENLGLEIHEFAPLGKENTLAGRLFYEQSANRDWFLFGITGFDKIRINDTGLNNQYGTNILLTNLEWRFPIVNDLNYYMGFIYPDFFFKTFYGIFFLDSGITWIDKERKKFLMNELSPGNFIYDGIVGTGTEPGTRNIIYSYGLGFRFNTFIIQTFLTSMNLTYSYSPINEQSAFYFTFSQAF